ncbi:hypothetical protein [Methylobacterium thuringiense]|uniref:Uncharacterized protein n=1 Tax=Methylobacterium thuringiense TaxID=1003091 RepID=A0ABQ4TQN5_9HYPH|nr:hypothetical protein [Methylobacterium thuringiense]GJE56937.1 hypothetical protein EKPJFOCH_3447 [Methylobacterium thuringiense]
MNASSDRPKDAEVVLNLQIANAEMRLKAVGVELTALLATDADIADAERRLAEALDALMDLRRDLWDLRMAEAP